MPTTMSRPVVIVAAVFAALGCLSHAVETEWSRAMTDVVILILAIDWLALHKRLREVIR